MPNDPLDTLLHNFLEAFVLPRVDEAFDRLAETMRHPAKPGRIPKSGPHKPKRIHKAQPQPRPQRKPRPNPAHKTHTYYDFFQVQPTASVEVLAAAHRALVKKHHPDQFPPGSEVWKKATANMKLINIAWEILGDVKKRAEYDRRIGVKQ
jgi:DnaJ domain